MLIAHATLVCVRYIFLELERRRAADIRTCGELFYYCCDELPDLKAAEAIRLIFQLMTTFLTPFLPDAEALIRNFVASLPAPLLRLCPIFGCES
jgi:hypothetical protein